MKECVICQQNGQKPGKQKMSGLPTESFYGPSSTYVPWYGLFRPN